MHEFGLCDGIIEAVSRRAAGRRVARVRVRAGTLLRIQEGAFLEAFAHAAAGTEAESAAVELQVLPARVLCRNCRRESQSNDAIVVCPACGGVDLELTGGEELILESIEYAPAGAEPLP